MSNSKNSAAGETAQTKPMWGVVALLGLMAATTIEGSLLITAISVAVFGIAAWLGGYMEPLTEKGGEQ